MLCTGCSQYVHFFVSCCCVHPKAPLKSLKIAHEFGFKKKKCIYILSSSFNIERLGECSDRDVQQCPCWLMGYSERLDQQRGTMLNLCWQELSNTPPFRVFFFKLRNLSAILCLHSLDCREQTKLNKFFLLALRIHKWTYSSLCIFRWVLFFFVGFMALFLFLLSIIYSWVNNKALLVVLNSEGHIVFIGFVGSRQPVLYMKAVRAQPLAFHNVRYRRSGVHAHTSYTSRAGTPCTSQVARRGQWFARREKLGLPSSWDQARWSHLCKQREREREDLPVCFCN